MICFTVDEWEDFQNQAKQILEDSVRHAVKDATIPLLAEISALNFERNAYRDNYTEVYNSYQTVQKWNIAGWSISAIELAILIVSWTIPKGN